MAIVIISDKHCSNIRYGINRPSRTGFLIFSLDAKKAIHSLAAESRVQGRDNGSD